MLGTNAEKPEANYPPAKPSETAEAPRAQDGALAQSALPKPPLQVSPATTLLCLNFDITHTILSFFQSKHDILQVSQTCSVLRLASLPFIFYSVAIQKSMKKAAAYLAVIPQSMDTYVRELTWNLDTLDKHWDVDKAIQFVRRVGPNTQRMNLDLPGILVFASVLAQQQTGALLRVKDMYSRLERISVRKRFYAYGVIEEDPPSPIEAVRKMLDIRGVHVLIEENKEFPIEDFGEDLNMQDDEEGQEGEEE
ncbi:hypothetical protein HK096_004697 [Nowakowskiella sp. JEL0078]|nr:hypothetical protein HK096_004697 [Nowakowskiella sp. JEL0078]